MAGCNSGGLQWRQTMVGMMGLRGARAVSGGEGENHTQGESTWEERTTVTRPQGRAPCHTRRKTNQRGGNLPMNGPTNPLSLFDDMFKASAHTQTHAQGPRNSSQTWGRG